MKKTIILGVAPVSHNLPKECRCGISAETVSQDVIACAAQGASVVHLHVRDQLGQQTDDLTEYDKTLRLIRKSTDIVIQGSTGGLSTLTLEERCVSVNHPLTETASLNIGSVNFGETAYINTLPDIRFWAAHMLEQKVAAEMEIFDLSMLETARMLYDHGLIKHFVFNLGLGFPSALPANEHYLRIMRNEFSRFDGAVWGVIHHQMNNLELLQKAVELGADMIRVGFEDSVFIRDGVIARNNAEAVAEAVKMLRSIGCEVATPEYARKKLKVLKPYS